MDSKHLSNDVCKKCMGGQLMAFVGEFTGDNGEKVYRSGICCKAYQEMPVDENTKPPQGCEYKFEHAVATSMSNCQR
jgi:hypothetical protein